MTEVNNLDLFLGKKISFFRSKMKWPLKALTEKLDISIQQMHRYEKGANKIPASTLYKIAHIFQVNINCFFEGYQEDTKEDIVREKFNILLVEDNPNDEFLLRKAVDEFSKEINLFTLNDGKSALNFFRDLYNGESTVLPKPSLIFLDLNLPNAKGLDILKVLKRRPLLQNIPVIILTTSIDEDDRLKSYYLQASGFIRKSFVYQEFKEQLHKALIYWTEAVELAL